MRKSYVSRRCMAGEREEKAQVFTERAATRKIGAPWQVGGWYFCDVAPSQPDHHAPPGIDCWDDTSQGERMRDYKRWEPGARQSNTDSRLLPTSKPNAWQVPYFPAAQCRPATALARS